MPRDRPVLPIVPIVPISGTDRDDWNRLWRWNREDVGFGSLRALTLPALNRPRSCQRPIRVLN